MFRVNWKQKNMILFSLITRNENCIVYTHLRPFQSQDRPTDPWLRRHHFGHDECHKALVFALIPAAYTMAYHKTPLICSLSGTTTKKQETKLMVNHKIANRNKSHYRILNIIAHIAYNHHFKVACDGRSKPTNFSKLQINCVGKFRKSITFRNDCLIKSYWITARAAKIDKLIENAHPNGQMNNLTTLIRITSSK